MSDNPISRVNPQLTVYLVVKGAYEAIEFYTKAFGAVLDYKLVMPDGSIAHSELTIGTSIRFGVSEENPEWGSKSPHSLGGLSSSFSLEVEDVDASFEHVKQCGVEVIEPPADQFYGYRGCTIVDPFGYKWFIATKVKEMSEAEMQAAMDSWIEQSNN